MVTDPAGILERLTRLYPRSIDLSLDRIRHLLARLGNPETRLPAVVHVAGTNGKGSTVATLRACLEAAGYRVHAYTSPHLVHFNERIRLAGRLIEDSELKALLEEIEAANDGTPITFFEITTAAAFLAFSRVPADLVLLEVGLGGALDATNVVSGPAVTVVTPVSMDHMGYLGHTLEAIAGEKAGILKCRRPAVIGPQRPQAMAVIEARAAGLAVPLHRHGREWQAEPFGAGWRFEGRRWRLELPLPRLPGRHQIDNAGAALATLELLEELAPLDQGAIAAGLGSIDWPARLQRLRRGPLTEALPPGWELWLDGGHNVDGAEMLAAHAAACWADRPLHIVFGTLTTRDPEAILRPLAARAAGIHGVAIPGEHDSVSAEAIAAAAARLGAKAAPAASVGAAIQAISAGQGRPSRILICGSLYLAGSILRENG